MRTGLAGVRALAANEFALARRDPAPIIISLVIPAVLMVFTEQTFRSALVERGLTEVSGAEQAVPGMAVVFTLFVAADVGYGIFREHSWGTWERLRASGLTGLELVLGKVTVPFCRALGQLLILLSVGALVTGLPLLSILPGIGLISVAYSAFIVSLGLLYASLARTIGQLNIMRSGTTLLMGGLGGAIVPAEMMPAWSQAIVPFVPVQWALTGYQEFFLTASVDIVTAARSTILLLLTATVVALFASLRLRLTDTRLSYV